MYKPDAERKDISKAVENLLGVRPTFYGAKELQALEIIRDKVDSYDNRKLVYSPNSLYSLHEFVFVDPVPMSAQVRRQDTYGFMRLNAYETALRPHFNNVLSCHRFEDHLKAPGGNLSYMAHPAWATYGLFKSSSSKLGVAYDFDEFHDGCDWFTNTPNLLSTVNVCFGYTVDKDGKRKLPTVMFTRVYGERLSPGITRLLDYFYYVRGYNIVVHNKWTNCYPDRFERHAQYEDEDVTFTTTALPPQFMIQDGVKDKVLVHRYPDIADMLMAKAPDGDVYIRERQACKRLIEYPLATTKGLRGPRCTDAGVELPEDTVAITVNTEKLMGSRLMTCPLCGCRDDADSIEHYDGFGLACRECMNGKIVFCDMLDRYILKESAVRVRIGGYSQWLPAEDVDDTYALPSMILIPRGQLAPMLMEFVPKDELVKYELLVPNADGTLCFTTVTMPPRFPALSGYGYHVVTIDGVNYVMKTCEKDELLPILRETLDKRQPAGV